MSSSSEPELDFETPNSHFFKQLEDLSWDRDTFILRKTRAYLDLYNKMPRGKRSFIGTRLVEFLVEVIQKGIWSEDIPTELWYQVVKFLTLNEAIDYFNRLSDDGDVGFGEFCDADWDDLFTVEK